MYATDWKEVVAPDEEARFADLAVRMLAIKQAHDAKYQERGRALHRQGLAGVRGVFTVPETLALPPELHVGPIRPGARHNAYVRFSAGSWARVKKQQPDVRAVAFKLVGVPGKKVLTGEEAPGTQDFLLNHGPTVPVRTPDEFVALAEAVSRSQAQALFRLIGSIGFGRAFSVLKGTIAGLNLPFSSYGSATFHSIAPSRLGPTACK